jgi:hypothetical protein
MILFADGISNWDSGREQGRAQGALPQRLRDEVEKQGKLLIITAL